MRKSIFIVAIVLLFSCCMPEGHTYINFSVSNKSSQTLLLGFNEGESEILCLTQLDTNKACVIRELDFEKFDDKDAAFYTLWISPQSEFRVYSADTVLLKSWKPVFDAQSTEKEFFRESDWSLYEWGEWGCPIFDFSFTITDSDLPPADSSSSSGKAINQ